MAPTQLQVRLLHFVYNADATLVGVVTDFAHRTLSPDTYECNLCDLTYGMFTKKKEWGRFVDALPYRVEFHTRDRFVRRGGHESAEFPAVYVEFDDATLAELITPAEINAADTLADLETLVSEKVETLAAT